MDKAQYSLFFIKIILCTVLTQEHYNNWKKVPSYLQLISYIKKKKNSKVR